jgi:hypothetical protein
MKEKIKNFNFMGIFMLVLTAVLGIVDASAVMAMPAITEAPVQSGDTASGKGVVYSGGSANTETTMEGSPELLEETVSDEIVKIRPTYTPFDTIMRNAKARKAEGWEYAWYSVDVRPVKTKAETLTAEGSTNVAGVKDGTLKVVNAGLFDVSDTISMEVSGVSYMFYVSKVDTDANTLTVSYVDAEGKPASVPALTVEDVDVYRLGRAAAEGEIKTASYTVLPTKESNYCQVFKWQVSETTLNQLHKKEIKWTMSDIEEQAACEFRIQQEASFLFGNKGKFYDKVKKKPVYTTGGITKYITKKETLNTTNGNAALIDLAKAVFQGNVGNRKRVLFMGSGFNAALSKIETVQKQLEAGNTKVVWGLEFNEIRTNFGSFMCMQHDLFDLYGWEDKALILDVDNIDKWQWTSENRTLDTKTSGEFDGDVRVYTEICGVALRYPDTHCIVSLAE